MTLSLSAGRFPWPQGGWNFSRRRPSRRATRSSTVAGASSGGRFRATPGGRPPPNPPSPAAPAMNPEMAVALGVLGGVLGIGYVISAAITASLAAVGAAFGAAFGNVMVAIVAMPVMALGACFEAMGNGIAEGLTYMGQVCTSTSVGFVAGSGLFAAGSWLEEELYQAKQQLRRRQQQQQADSQPQEPQPGEEGAEQPRDEELQGEGAAGHRGDAGAVVTAAAAVAAVQDGPVVAAGVPAALAPLGRVGQWVASWEPDNVRAALPLASMGFGMLVMRAALSVMVHSRRAQRSAA